MIVAGQSDRRGEAGFTLIEMLITLAIIGGLAGVAVLAVGIADRGAGGEVEARRLANRFQFAADEAMITGRPIIFAWDAEGYRFAPWDDGRGVQEGDSEVLGPRHDLDSGLRLSTRMGDGPVVIEPDGTGRTVRFLVAASAGSWGVQFDGVNAAPFDVSP